MKREAKPRPVSTIQKKAEASTTMMKTITEVIQVSLRLGHTILRASARTWLKNWAGEVRGLATGASTVTVEADAEAAAIWGLAPAAGLPVRRPEVNLDLAMGSRGLFVNA